MKTQYIELCGDEGIELLWPVWGYNDEDVWLAHNCIEALLLPNTNFVILPGGRVIQSKVNGRDISFPVKKNYICGEAKCIIGQPAYPDSILPEQLSENMRIQEQTAVKYYADNIKSKIRAKIETRVDKPFNPHFGEGPIQFK